MGENHFVILVIIGTSVMFLWFLYYMLKLNKNSKAEEERRELAEQKKPLKDVELYSEDGILLKSFKNVYVSHWDNNIYHLYTKKDGKLIVRLHKGANMLLSIINTNSTQIKESTCLNS